MNAKTAPDLATHSDLEALRLDVEKFRGDIRADIAGMRTDVAWLKYLGGAVFLGQLAALAKLFWPVAP